MNYYYTISVHHYDGRTHDDAFRPLNPEIAGEIVRILLACRDERIKAIVVDVKKTVNQEKAV